MDRRVSLITLGVDDLHAARRFYSALGWDGSEVEETVFIQAGPLAIVLWSADKLAADCGLSRRPAEGGACDGIVLAHNVRSRAEVDAVMATAAAAGASITRAAADTFYGGYAGVFCDPDGHAWEIAHNPGFTLGDDGSLVLPDFD